jgi:hypothetical protein
LIPELKIAKIHPHGYSGCTPHLCSILRIMM